MDALPRLAKVLRQYKENHTIAIPECWLSPLSINSINGIIILSCNVVNDVYVLYVSYQRMYVSTLSILIPLMAYVYVSTRISKIPVLVRALPVLERVPVLLQAFFSVPVLVAGRFLRYPYAQSASSRTSTTHFVPVLVRGPASSSTGISWCPY